MSLTSNQPGTNRKQNALNLTLTAVVGPVGCLTAAIILAALALGLWLDSLLDTKPMFTIGLVVGSMPVSLVFMFVFVRFFISRIKTKSAEDSNLTEGGANK